MDPITVGQTATARLTPTGPNDEPELVTNIVYDVVPAGSFSIIKAPDGLSAQYTALPAAAGLDCMGTVTATNSLGITINDHQPLPTVLPALTATKLNMVITTP